MRSRRAADDMRCDSKDGARSAAVFTGPIPGPLSGHDVAMQSASERFGMQSQGVVDPQPSALGSFQIGPQPCVRLPGR